MMILSDGDKRHDLQLAIISGLKSMVVPPITIKTEGDGYFPCSTRYPSPPTDEKDAQPGLSLSILFVPQ